MSLHASRLREFEPGTTGWTLDDLKDPAIRRLWDEGRYEIIEGVLTSMPAARFSHGGPIGNLIFLLKSYDIERKLGWTLAPEADVAATQDRIFRCDLVLMTPADIERQRAMGSWDDENDQIGIVRVPPTLIVEVVSKGHERHDRVTKREFYARFGVPNYWIVDTYQKGIECLIADGRDYRLECAGKGDEAIEPSAYPGLRISLQQVWAP
jgi:Uma2 family endonuclease